jgi:hypothetical protein
VCFTGAVTGTIECEWSVETTHNEIRKMDLGWTEVMLTLGVAVMILGCRSSCCHNETACGCYLLWFLLLSGLMLSIIYFWYLCCIAGKKDLPVASRACGHYVGKTVGTLQRVRAEFTHATKDNDLMEVNTLQKLQSVPIIETRVS